MIPTKEMSPHVPISVGEIVDNVLEAANIGITIVHLHARHPETGRPTCRASLYQTLSMVSVNMTKTR